MVASIAYATGAITRNDLLDVFIGVGTGRYLRVAGFVAAWAFLNTLLVTILQPRSGTKHAEP